MAGDIGKEQSSPPTKITYPRRTVVKMLTAFGAALALPGCISPKRSLPDPATESAPGTSPDSVQVTVDEPAAKLSATVSPDLPPVTPKPLSSDAELVQPEAFRTADEITPEDRGYQSANEAFLSPDNNQQEADRREEIRQRANRNLEVIRKYLSLPDNEVDLYIQTGSLVGIRSFTVAGPGIIVATGPPYGINEITKDYNLSQINRALDMIEKADPGMAEKLADNFGLKAISADSPPGNFFKSLPADWLATFQTDFGLIIVNETETAEKPYYKFAAIIYEESAGMLLKRLHDPHPGLSKALAFLQWTANHYDKLDQSAWNDGDYLWAEGETSLNYYLTELIGQQHQGWERVEVPICPADNRLVTITEYLKKYPHPEKQIIQEQDGIKDTLYFYGQKGWAIKGNSQTGRIKEFQFFPPLRYDEYCQIQKKPQANKPLFR